MTTEPDSDDLIARLEASNGFEPMRPGDIGNAVRPDTALMREAAGRIRELRRWRESAIGLLNEWEKVWDAAKGPDTMTMIPKAIVFDGNGSDWSALRDAERWIREQGWSVGPSDTSHMRAVMFGPNWAISKWRNLTESERASTHAVLQGNGRVGPLTLYSLVPPTTEDPTP